VEKKWKVPIGGWSSDPRLKRVGLYTLLFLDQSLEGFALFMLKEIMGWEYAEIQVLVARMRQALRDWRLYPYYEMYSASPSIFSFIRSGVLLVH
jgi:hypothetical protein